MCGGNGRPAAPHGEICDALVGPAGSPPSPFLVARLASCRVSFPPAMSQTKLHIANSAGPDIVGLLQRVRPKEATAGRPIVLVRLSGG